MSMKDPKDDKGKKVQDDAEALTEHRMRMRFDWHDLIEDLIQKGQEKGVFDNLPGKGKPLNLKKNRYEGDRELANTLLKENNLRPAWIVTREDIINRTTRLRQDMAHMWRRHDQAFRLAQDETRRGALTISWDDACRRWEKEINALNGAIGDFNLRRPIDNLELYKLRLDDELKRVRARRWLK